MEPIADPETEHGFHP